MFGYGQANVRPRERHSRVRRKRRRTTDRCTVHVHAHEGESAKNGQDGKDMEGLSLKLIVKCLSRGMVFKHDVLPGQSCCYLRCHLGAPCLRLSHGGLAEGLGLALQAQGAGGRARQPWLARLPPRARHWCYRS